MRWSSICLLALMSVSALVGERRAIAAEEPRIDPRITFSTDGGKTFTKVPQVSGKLETMKLKVTWDNPRPEDEKEGYTAVLFCKESDFASALTGKQKWGDEPAWFQRSTPQYLPPTEPKEFTFDLDLRGRPEGVMGVLNRWDPASSKQVDAPLPACPALGPGKYTFVVRVSYFLRNVKPAKRVDGTVKFVLSINSPTTTPAVSGNHAGR